MIGLHRGTDLRLGPQVDDHGDQMPGCSYTVQYAVDWSTLGSFCDSEECMETVCELGPVPQIPPGWPNPSDTPPPSSPPSWKTAKCADVLPSMAARCNTMRLEVAAACTAGGTWRHPADFALLDRWWAGCTFLPTTGLSCSQQMLPSRLRAAFSSAAAYENSRGHTFLPSRGCAPPFCFSFKASDGGDQPTLPGSVTPDCSHDGGLAGSLNLLELLYPCNLRTELFGAPVVFSSGNKSGAVHANSTMESRDAAASEISAWGGSTLAGQLCGEAYTHMADVVAGRDKA